MLYQLSHVRVRATPYQQSGSNLPRQDGGPYGPAESPGPGRSPGRRSHTPYAGSSACHHGTGRSRRLARPTSSASDSSMALAMESMSGTSTRQPSTPTYS
jgi:hypothetical protein